jgi:F-type H+-transporting ATPase subunit b
MNRLLPVVALALSVTAGATEPDAHGTPAAHDPHAAPAAHDPHAAPAAHPLPIYGTNPVGHAEDPHGTHGANPNEHGDAHGDEHGGEHHVDYTGDQDHDGTPNWLDATYDGNTHGFDPFGLGIPFWPNSDTPFVLPNIVFHAFHFLILLALLWMFGARPIGDAIKNRALAIRKDLEDATKARDDARREHEAIVARLAQFQQEVAAMRARTEAEAKADAEQLVVKAKAEAERIQATAEKNIDEELRRAKASLRAETIELAVQLARTTLQQQVGSEDQRLLARQFLDSLKSGGTHG